MALVAPVARVEVGRALTARTVAVGVANGAVGPRWTWNVVALVVIVTAMAATLTTVNLKTAKASGPCSAHTTSTKSALSRGSYLTAPLPVRYAVARRRGRRQTKDPQWAGEPNGREPCAVPLPSNSLLRLLRLTHDLICRLGGAALSGTKVVASSCLGPHAFALTLRLEAAAFERAACGC